MMGFAKAIGALLLDPAALVLVFCASLAAYALGHDEGSTRAAAACQADQLRKDLAAVTAQGNALKARLETLNHLAESDAARAAEAARAEARNKEIVRATPESNRACLDAAAARRLRQIR